MNLASCVDDWSSTRTAGELLAGTKRLHLAPRQNRSTIQHRACTRMATDAHEDRCEAMRTPQCRSGRGGVHRRVEGRPRVTRSQSHTDPPPAGLAPVIARHFARRWAERNAGSRSGKFRGSSRGCN